MIYGDASVQCCGIVRSFSNESLFCVFVLYFWQFFRNLFHYVCREETVQGNFKTIIEFW